MERFADRIKDSILTPSDRKIAEYCLSNQSIVAFQSAAEIAKELDVSDVSVIRFARKLGYSGFTELKHAWQEELSSALDANEENPVAQFIGRRTYKTNIENFTYENAEQLYCSLIHETLSALNEATLQHVAEKISNSRNKYVCGIRTRATAAEALTTLLRRFVPGVIPLTTEGYKSYMQALDFSKDDCVIFFTFGRYSLFEQELLARIKERGSYLIVITDKKASHAAQAADELIYCAGDVRHSFYSSVATVLIGECIANAIADLNWKDSESRIKSSEQYLNSRIPKQH